MRPTAGFERDEVLLEVWVSARRNHRDTSLRRNGAAALRSARLQTAVATQQGRAAGCGNDVEHDAAGAVGGHH